MDRYGVGKYLRRAVRFIIELNRFLRSLGLVLDQGKISNPIVLSEKYDVFRRKRK